MTIELRHRRGNPHASAPSSGAERPSSAKRAGWRVVTLLAAAAVFKNSLRFIISLFSNFVAGAHPCDLYLAGSCYQLKRVTICPLRGGP